MDQKDFSEVRAQLANTPDTIREMTKALSIEEQTLKPDADTFSILENICHLRDIEERGYSIRIKRILNEDSPFLPDINGKTLAIERDYQTQHLREELDGFSAFREESLAYLQGITLADLEKTAELQDVGTLTLGTMLSNMIKHDKEHLQFISDLLHRLR